MSGTSRNPVFVFVFVISFCLLQQPASAQSQQPFLDKKVSFTFSNMSMATVLQSLGNKTGVRFSYNPDLIQPGRNVNMRFNNLPLHEVLTQLFADPTIAFREIGNQVVIYRGDPEVITLAPNQKLIPGKPQLVIPQGKKPDTVYSYRIDTLIINRTDTIFRSVSITHFDTIRITDTVFVEKNMQSPKPNITKVDDADEKAVKHLKYLEYNGFYTGLYFEMLPGSATVTSTQSSAGEYADLMKQSKTGELNKFSAGIIAGYDYHKFGVRSGFGFMSLGEKFEYAYTIASGGFFRTDTVETYYTLNGVDTAWFYVTDSSWIEKDAKNYSYRNDNLYRYIDVPLSLKFRVWQNSKAEIYAMGGVNAAFLVSVDAIHIDPADKNNVILTSQNDLNPVLFSWHAGMGTAIKFSGRSGVIAEATYRKQTNSLYSDLPIEKRYGLLGFKLAAYVKF